MRFILFIISFFYFSYCFNQNNLNVHPGLLPHLDASLAPFYHGVASGDPTENSVIIWSKVILDKSVTNAEISFELATDSLFTKTVKKSMVITDQNSDFTVKEKISNLKQNTTYYYRFIYQNKYSIIGTTKTLPTNPAAYKIAFASCSNYEWGFFTNYRSIAVNKDIDLVVHLGDYIYEYGVGTYGDTSIGRLNVPSHEIISLDDYRTRYSLYRLDKDLMKLHQLKPMITTWDDHEIANNTYNEGAENHQKEEGNWLDRKSAAIKAYYEWLPIAPKLNEPLYRSFSIGPLINLIVLDTRVEERSIQSDSVSAPDYYDTTRTILGNRQLTWLEKNLEKRAKWNLICNQVPFGPMYSGSKNGEKYMDGWDGYPIEREKLIKYIESKEIHNTVFVTGDYHRAIALESDRNGTASSSDNIAVELIVSSITSANDDEYFSKEEAVKRHERYLTNNPHMKYCNNTDNGYLILEIYLNEIKVNYVMISSIKTPNGITSVEKTFVIESDKHELITR